MNKKKILQILPADDIGIGLIRKEISLSLPASEYEVTLVFLTGSLQSELNDNEKSILFSFTKSEIKGPSFKVLRKLYIFLKKENFDVVITHRFKAFQLIQKLNKIIKIPRCISVTHGFGDFKRFSRRISLYLYTDDKWLFVGVSESVSSYLKSLNNGAISKQVITINNAINCAAKIPRILSTISSRQQLSIPSDAFVFGTVGRLVSSKGQYDLLQAFHLIHHTIPNSMLIIIGEGPNENKLKQYIHDHNLHKSIFLLGSVPEAYRYIRAFDTFILPSHKEGFGLVLVEAMAAKLPIIATNTGGISAVVGEHGKLVPPQNIKLLAEAMKHYSELDNDERATIGNNLHLRLLKYFDINLFHEKYRALIGSSIKESLIESG